MNALKNSSKKIGLALLLLGLGLNAVLAADLPTFNLTIRAGRFIPETIEVPANTKFRLQIKNEGPGPEEFESNEPRKEKVLSEGASSFLIYQPLKPGSYPFMGEFHQATAKGKIVAK